MVSASRTHNQIITSYADVIKVSKIISKEAFFQENEGS
jgi:hypothetical protein